VTDAALRVEVAGVRGYPATVATDLDRCDAAAADRCALDVDGQHITVTAVDAAAAWWLYEWLEESVDYYRDEFVDATAEHAAARHLAAVVYDEVAR
jgi:hypothetical protein